MNLNKIHTKEELDKALVSDSKKMTFLLRQAIEFMKILGIAGIKQSIDEYEIIIKLKNSTEVL